jgi:thioesterase-3
MDTVESRLSVVVRSTEIDINGHVNNAKYVEYLEWGREDFYECVHLPYEALYALGAVTVTVRLDLNYRREARQGETLTVITRPGYVGRTSFNLQQTIVREADDALIADASVTLVTMDPAARRSIPVPQALRQYFQGR